MEEDSGVIRSHQVMKEFQTFNRKCLLRSSALYIVKFTFFGVKTNKAKEIHFTAG